MSTVQVTPPQLFYWKAEFEDGTILSKFDDDGEEILISVICGKECWTHNTLENTEEIKQFSNYFGDLEIFHGRVVQFGFYPFTLQMKKDIERLQPNVEIVLGENTKPITKLVPEDSYVSFKTEIEVSYSSMMGSSEINGMEARVSKMIIGIFNRKTSIGEFYEIVVDMK